MSKIDLGPNPGIYAPTISQIQQIRQSLGIGTIDNNYDLGPMGFSNLPDSSEIDWMIIPRAMQVVSGASGYAYAITPSAADATFQILKNETLIGTVFFEEGVNTGVVNITFNVSFVAQDRVYFVAPSTPDNMLENVQLTILATIV